MAVSVSFQPGDVIQDYCEPFMKILYNVHKGTHCDYCFQSGNSLRRCVSCKQVFYCNKNCQVSDWKMAHKVECSLTYFRSFPDSDSLFTESTLDFKYRLLRLFAILKLHPELAQKSYPVYNGTWRCFDEFMSHYDQVQQNPEFDKYCTEIGKRLIQEESLGLNSTDLDPLRQYFLKLSGIFRTNAFCIYNDEKTERIGAGLYVETSVFDHSCKPTAFFLMKGTLMQIRAIGPVRNDEKPTISYILAHKGRSDRQKILWERYNFHCQCERCNEEESLGESLNQDRIAQLLESSSGFDSSSSWTYVLKVHRELIETFRSMYWEHDERITNQIYWTCTKLLEISKKSDTLPRKTLEDFCIQARDHLLVTYGPTHETFQQFQQLVSSLSSF